MRLRALAATVMVGFAACAPQGDIATRTGGTAVDLPQMRSFTTARPQPSRRSNPQLARDFLDLTFELENGRAVPRLTRFEGDVPVALRGSVTPVLRKDLDRKGYEFMAAFLEVEAARHPANIDALAELGQVYTRLGRLSAGLEVDHQLVRLVPDNPTVHYNLACSLALLGFDFDITPHID